MRGAISGEIEKTSDRMWEQEDRHWPHVHMAPLALMVSDIGLPVIWDVWIFFGSD